MQRLGDVVYWGVIVTDAANVTCPPSSPSAIALAPRGGVEADWQGAQWVGRTIVPPASDCAMYEVGTGGYARHISMARPASMDDVNALTGSGRR